MADTYKAIFTCPELKERRIWYVGSRHEARKHLHAHIYSGSHKKKLYRESAWEFKVRPIFQSEGDAGCDHSTFE